MMRPAARGYRRDLPTFRIPLTWSSMYNTENTCKGFLVSANSSATIEQEMGLHFCPWEWGRLAMARESSLGADMAGIAREGTLSPDTNALAIA